MDPKSLGVVARLKARPDKVNELRSLLFGLLAPTRREPGCIRYEMLVNRKDPTEFTFIEEWQDEPALEVHFGTDHIRYALERFPDLLAEELDVRRYNLVG
ncbi:MAG: antibiotic biosynthesis monooxygenase [Gammaproteobacteria bacterium]|nr:antibiotic biosynthesis monooxygenase [Gammaproteobacteria bacterium]